MLFTVVGDQRGRHDAEERIEIVAAQEADGRLFGLVAEAAQGDLRGVERTAVEAIAGAAKAESLEGFLCVCHLPG